MPNRLVYMVTRSCFPHFSISIQDIPDILFWNVSRPWIAFTTPRHIPKRGVKVQIRAQRTPATPHWKK